ncbi:coiled-coil-helix-coiled-coil-helix domain-containing protein 2 [Lipomyces oligophaga]|uniref:coiled-coil-helix-coiled-coil-helix domain-containing protein 2 n=1 Tax=Lipomyces oligophaga TaxID=45792 RepID=UPI0034CD01BC
MPRSSNRRSAGPSTQHRQASTYSAAPRYAPPPASAPHPSAPAVHQAAPPAVVQQKQPGLFGQMASTAAGVAVGSTVGHMMGNAISGIFGSSGSVEQAPPATAVAATAPADQYAPRSCDVDARNLTKCLDDNSGNMQACDWYLQQLKSCQEFSRSL